MACRRYMYITFAATCLLEIFCALIPAHDIFCFSRGRGIQPRSANTSVLADQNSSSN